MKKISLERLLAESREEEYSKQYQDICGLVEKGKLIPVKKSPLNGKKPALHLSYWIVEEEPDYSEEIEELSFQMAPAIRTDYYLKHLKTYREEAEWVRLLNRYFLRREQEPAEKGAAGEPAAVSLNERSFQIWGREKFLQREQGRTILAHCGVGMEQLHVYNTAEPLAYYSASRNIPQNILILENKDTFYSMRKYLMEEGQRETEVPIGEKPCGKSCCRQEEEQGRSDPAGRIFGTVIGTLIYGAGKGILRSIEDFDFCVEPHVNAGENQILYFGDLDYEGIGIYERLANLFHEGFSVRPFVQAYEKMLEKAERQGGKNFLPETSENQNRNLSGLFFQYFSEPVTEKMKEILEAGKYIPQEIVNITDYAVFRDGKGKTGPGGGERTGEEECSTNF